MTEAQGQVVYLGQRIDQLPAQDMRALRQQMQIVFQDPFGALSPRLSVADIITEGLDVIAMPPPLVERREIAARAMLDVGLDPATMDRYPHEFSGGQRQRIGIARALAVEPRVLIADEPVSALDVSVQAQIISLLQDLRRHLGLSLLLISHDLDVVELLCERVSVLYLGRVMESGLTRHVMQAPRHPYSRALLAAVPKADPLVTRGARLLSGDIPSPLDPPSGCVFRTRCFYHEPHCAQSRPALLPADEPWQVACHRDPLSVETPPS